MAVEFANVIREIADATSAQSMPEIREYLTSAANQIEEIALVNTHDPGLNRDTQIAQLTIHILKFTVQQLLHLDAKVRVQYDYIVSLENKLDYLDSQRLRQISAAAHSV